MSHLNANNILIENQHGFRAGNSCAVQLITLTEDILHALEQRKQVDIILLEFAKDCTLLYPTRIYLWNYNTMELEIISLTGSGHG